MTAVDPATSSAARTLAEIVHALASTDRCEERLTVSLRLLGEIVPYQRCALLELVPKHGRCELLTVPQLGADERRRLRTRLVALLRMMGDESPIAGVRCEEEPAAAQAVPACPHVALPVIGLNHVTGILYLEQADASYDEHALRLLSVVAAQIGAFVTTVRLRDDELEHARQLGIALQRLEETDRRKDEFLAMLGHELRNPLGAINNALRIIDQHPAADVDRYHKLIDRQIQHLSRIVDDLLDASRVRLGKVVLDRQPIDLRTVAQQWCDAFGSTSRARAHEVRIEGGPEPVIVEGDAARLEQIVSNLLTNALKYTPAGGSIRVSIRNEDGCAVLRVRDSGIGMTPDVLERVFDLFTQADDSLARADGGLGLGLPLVRSLVELHGGTVEAHSEGLGHGSEFVVRLPSSDAHLALSAPPESVECDHSPLKILVLEDNEDALETIREMLSLWGYEVDSATDGASGLARALQGCFDVLLIDIGLPHLDGYEVVRRIRAAHGTRAPYLIAMTGYGQPQDRRRAIEAGFDVHMVKPIKTMELKHRLAHLTNERRRSS